MPGLRAAGVGAAARVLGLPWRLRPGRGRPLAAGDPRLRRVLVIKPCCMGDVLMATAALAALRRALPSAQIDFAVAPFAAPAISHNPRINSVVDSPAGGQETSFSDYRQLAQLVRAGKYGAALVLDRSPLLNMVPLMAGVPVRAGLDSDGRGIGLTHPVPCPSRSARHEVEWYLDVVRALGITAPSEDAYLEFYPTEEDRAEAGRALAPVGETESGLVAIHVGGGVNPGMRLLSKRWAPERWARIADWLAETYDSSIVLLGGPGDEDRRAADELKAALFPATHPYVTDLVGRLGWGALAATIERCRLFLGHDTGAMHLAAAVRTPVVAVFGPTDPARYGPWDPSGRSIAVAPNTAVASDAGSLRRASATAGDIPYNSSVAPEEVWAAVQRAYALALGLQEVRLGRRLLPDR